MSPEINLSTMRADFSAQQNIDDEALDSLIQSNPQDAQVFLLEVLNHENKRLRRRGLRFTARLNSLTNLDLKKAVQKILVSDEYDLARMEAAAALAKTNGNDEILILSLSNEPEALVKSEVFQTFLQNHGLDFVSANEFTNKIRSNELEPTLENAEKIIAEWKAQNP
jgi:ABC-type uncharacterized transport system ATPase subunit